MTPRAAPKAGACVAITPMVMLFAWRTSMAAEMRLSARKMLTAVKGGSAGLGIAVILMCVLFQVPSALMQRRRT